MKTLNNTNNQNKKQSVICIYSDEYGFLGVAKNYFSALHFLRKEDWISDKVEMYDDNDNIVTIVDYLGHNWFDQQLSWTINEFNDFWVGHYSLVKCDVFSM